MAKFVNVPPKNNKRGHNTRKEASSLEKRVFELIEDVKRLTAIFQTGDKIPTEESVDAMAELAKATLSMQKRNVHAFQRGPYFRSQANATLVDIKDEVKQIVTRIQKLKITKDLTYQERNILKKFFSHVKGLFKVAFRNVNAWRNGGAHLFLLLPE